MQIRSIEIKQFRCFKQLVLSFDKPIVLIAGSNGSGKTSILEALHYLGYLRSFRTGIPQHLVKCGQEVFFLRAMIADGVGQETEIQAGFSDGKRLVKVNKQSVRSYKELVDHYRVIAVTEDDLQLIKGGPSLRRDFLDQMILLKDPDFIQILRKYRHILENRNSLLKKENIDSASLGLWTRQLWSKSCIIQKKRTEALLRIAEITNKLLRDHFNQTITINLEYKPKRSCNQSYFEDFLGDLGTMFKDEFRYERSLFGIHLDDFTIDFQKQRSKVYASRGQQKLTILLLKIAQVLDLAEHRGPCLLLLDDFMTDFDKNRGEQLIDIIAGIGVQAIFASPLQKGVFEELLLKKGAQLIELNQEDGLGCS